MTVAVAAMVNSVCVAVVVVAGLTWVDTLRPSGPMYKYLSVAADVPATE